MISTTSAPRGSEVKVTDREASVNYTHRLGGVDVTLSGRGSGDFKHVGFAGVGGQGSGVDSRFPGPI